MAQFRDQKLLDKIAARLKDLREERGLSQEKVYNELDIHIARIEVGKVNVSVSTISRLCEYFDITLTEFFEKIDGNY